MTNRIQWPEGWPCDEGWVQPKGSWLTEEKRKPSTLHASLKLNSGIGLVELVHELGGPSPRRFDRSLEELDNWIRNEFDKNKIRPTKNSTEGNQWEQWLTWHLNKSLASRCDFLGLPKLRTDRNLASVDAWIREYYRKTGMRPSELSPGAKAINHWLVRRGSSLPRRCDELNIKFKKSA